MKEDQSINYFCKNIKHLRHSEKLSQREMARKLKIGVKSLAKIESGILPPKLRTDVIGLIYAEFKIPPFILFSSNFEAYYDSK